MSLSTHGNSEPRKADLGYVKRRVRRYALAVEAFTTEDLVKDTGLNANSIRTELSRMVDAGLLQTEKVARATGEAGGPLNRYRLTTDLEKRVRLSTELEDLLPRQEPPSEPTTRAYDRACHLITDAEQLQLRQDREGAETQSKMEPLLNDARRWLNSAIAQEGSEDAPALIRAHLDFHQARLCLLENTPHEAEELLLRAKKAFEQSQNESMLLEISILMAQLRVDQARSDTGQAPPSRDAVALSRALATAFDALVSDVVTQPRLRRTLREVMMRATEAMCSSGSSSVPREAEVRVINDRRLDEGLWLVRERQRPEGMKEFGAVLNKDR